MFAVLFGVLAGSRLRPARRRRPLGARARRRPRGRCDRGRAASRSSSHSPSRRRTAISATSTRRAVAVPADRPPRPGRVADPLHPLDPARRPVAGGDPDRRRAARLGACSRSPSSASPRRSASSSGRSIVVAGGVRSSPPRGHGRPSSGCSASAAALLCAVMFGVRDNLVRDASTPHSSTAAARDRGHAARRGRRPASSTPGRRAAASCASASAHRSPLPAGRARRSASPTPSSSRASRTDA